MTHKKINSYSVVLYQSIQFSKMAVSNRSLPYPVYLPIIDTYFIINYCL